MQVEEGVLFRVLEIFAGVRAQDLDLLLSVAEGVREDVQREGLEAFGALQVVPGADFLLEGEFSAADRCFMG